MAWYVILVLFVLESAGVIDITIRVEKHVDGVKTVCLRGPEVKGGQ